MYSFGNNSAITNIVFDLNWGFPDSGQDYLDGSCLVYSANTFCQVFDYAHIFSADKAITHSGDVITGTTGHHKICIDLSKVGPTIDRIFFTLSAWNSPTISYYKNPTVSLFDQLNPTKELSQFVISTANSYQAVIMCALVRTNKGWIVYRLGVGCSGNAKNYLAIQSAISNQPILI